MEYGKKNTIDSATLINKGLEIIEAVHLFHVPPEMIDVVVHRESVIHSMIEFIDNSIIAQIAVPDMKLPIQYAITYPKRVESTVKPLDFKIYDNLTFFEPDYETFEGLNICKKVISEGGILPTVLNSANEEAVKLFLDKKIKFLDIIEIIKVCLKKIKNINIYKLDDIIYYDKFIRDFINNDIDF